MDNKVSRIAIVTIATNKYFALGLRFIKKMKKHYRGNSIIDFHLFADSDPSLYIEMSNVIFHMVDNDTDWNRTNLTKLDYAESLKPLGYDYLYLIDADTNINVDFYDDIFLHDTLVMEHPGNRLDPLAYERNPLSTAYIPYSDDPDQMYYMGCFVGGHSDKIFDAIETLQKNIKLDTENGILATWNEESHWNAYWYKNKPAKVFLFPEEVIFDISDKGFGPLQWCGRDFDFLPDGIDNILNDILLNYEKDWDIIENQVIVNA